MRKKKTAMYLLVITSLLAMSVVLPLLINAFSGYVAGKIRQMPDGVEKMTESADRGDGTDHTVNIAADETERADPPSVMSDEKPASGAGAPDDKDTIVDVPYFDEPIYDSAKEESAANEKAYEDMTERLSSLSEAASAYRERFHPSYEELNSGLMNEFISGKENLFYEEIANYCFGHYNTTHPVERVRFLAVTEDTEERTTVVLEFYTSKSAADEFSVPDLAYCTYNKNTQAFVFFTSA